MPETQPDDLIAPPTKFDLVSHLPNWCAWTRMTTCFWPRYSGFHTSRKADAELAPMVRAGGLYLIADSTECPATIHPTERSVIYIGETSWFKRRMGQFGDSAGLWEDKVRTRGHSAGFRVNLDRAQLWLAFYPIAWPRGERHLGIGLRKWIEALALEEHRIANGSLPIVNAGEEATIESAEVRELAEDTAANDADEHG